MTLGKVTPSKYFINNNQLEKIIFYKDLGIYLRITFYLIQIMIIIIINIYICKKVYFSLNSIFRGITTKSPIVLLNAYTIDCRSILEYASIIWKPFSNVSKFHSLIDHIERKQILFTSRLITRFVVYTNS